MSALDTLLLFLMPIGAVLAGILAFASWKAFSQIQGSGVRWAFLFGFGLFACASVGNCITFALAVMDKL